METSKYDVSVIDVYVTKIIRFGITKKYYSIKNKYRCLLYFYKNDLMY